MNVITQAESVLQLSEDFAALQTPGGAIVEDRHALQSAESILSEMDGAYDVLCKKAGSTALPAYEAFHTDTQQWLQAGLESDPDFKATHETWPAPKDTSEYVPFLAPLRIPNTALSYYFGLTFALVKPHEVEYEGGHEMIQEAAPNLNKGTEVQVVSAPVRSSSYRQSDGSVIFSELLASSRRRDQQTFGMFIVSDFQARYRAMTAGSKLAKGPQLQKALAFNPEIKPDDERFIWLQVHDRYHDVGNLPHSLHLGSKMRFAPAVLDELKADCGAFMGLYGLGGVPRTIALRHVVDKMFRFPTSEHSYSSVDGAVGEVLLRKAIQTGALNPYRKGLELDEDQLVGTVDSVFNDVLNIEKAADLQTYLNNCAMYLLEANVVMPPDRAKRPMDILTN